MEVEPLACVVSGSHQLRALAAVVARRQTPIVTTPAGNPLVVTVVVPPLATLDEPSDTDDTGAVMVIGASAYAVARND